MQKNASNQAFSHTPSDSDRIFRGFYRLVIPVVLPNREKGRRGAKFTKCASNVCCSFPDRGFFSTDHTTCPWVMPACSPCGGQRRCDPTLLGGKNCPVTDALQQKANG